MTLAIQPIPILSDNYAWLMREKGSAAMAIVDPAQAAPVLAAIEGETRTGGKLAWILLTHHHDDHIAAAEEIRGQTGALIVGATADRHRLPRLDRAVQDGDTVTLGDSTAEIIDTPGHTRGHIAYFFPATPALFCGDTLFSLGCGRLLEGTAAEMHHSLARLALLPDDTLICCGHEYTASNARFALAALPDNVKLAEQASRITQKRAKGLPTVPVRLGDEREINPFLLARDLADFTRLRSWKDGFH